MFACRRTACHAALAVAAVTALHLASEAPPTAPPPTGRGTEAPADEFRVEAERARAYEHWRQALVRSVGFKKRTVEEVIAGHLTLCQAAERFAAADGWRPRHLRTPAGQFPGATEAERRCRQVLQHVREALDEQPARRDAVAARLEAELRQPVATRPAD